MSRNRAYEDRPYRNHEGYSDPTAYLAVRNCTRERDKKQTSWIIVEEKKKKRKHNKYRGRKPVNR